MYDGDGGNDGRKGAMNIGMMMIMFRRVRRIRKRQWWDRTRVILGQPNNGAGPTLHANPGDHLTPPPPTHPTSAPMDTRMITIIITIIMMIIMIMIMIIMHIMIIMVMMIIVIMTIV